MVVMMMMMRPSSHAFVVIVVKLLLTNNPFVNTIEASTKVQQPKSSQGHECMHYRLPNPCEFSRALISIDSNLALDEYSGSSNREKQVLLHSGDARVIK